MCFVCASSCKNRYRTTSGARRSLEPALQHVAGTAVVGCVHDEASALEGHAAFRRAVPLHVESFIGEGELHSLRHERHRFRMALHRRHFAVDPRSEALHEIAHHLRAYPDRHDDLNASADVNSSSQAARARTYPNGEWVVGATSLEQR